MNCLVNTLPVVIVTREPDAEHVSYNVFPSWMNLCIFYGLNPGNGSAREYYQKARARADKPEFHNLPEAWQVDITKK